MGDADDDAELARRFSEFASSTSPRAPLYAALGDAVAADPALYRLLLHAPPTQQLPVLLFAAVHDLLLGEPDHPLAEWYPNLTERHRSPTDPALLPTFRSFVDERATELADLLATRSTQTNEVGRCLLFLPQLAELAAEVGPIALLDVGTSGGLNLLLDRYEYHYRVDGSDAPAVVVGRPSPVVLTASTRGRFDVPTTMPPIVARCGIDRHPIDVTDPGEARWLEACVWPDQRDRFLRLRAAIELARQSPPEILAGDATASLAPAIDRLRLTGHVVVTNSWVLNYLTGAERAAYAAELDRIGAEVDLSWVFVEAPGLTPELPWRPSGDRAGAERFDTFVAVCRWRDGRRSVDEVARAHPHGYWLHALERTDPTPR